MEEQSDRCGSPDLQSAILTPARHTATCQHTVISPSYVSVGVCLSRSVCERQTETVCQEVYVGVLKQKLWRNRKSVIKSACVLKTMPKSLCTVCDDSNLEGSLHVTL